MTTHVSAAPTPAPPFPAFVTIAGACALLGISRRRFAELRADPAFPPGREFGGKAALRFSVERILRWADEQPERRFATRGGARPRAGGPSPDNPGSRRGRFVKVQQART